uniref:Uncharacterized protein n=1 Tax=uncultured marine virus TaxID=186617 RepID=A0A0F7L375_9VIRU|nr:hypothetical protein [uncultured marine virus]
MLKDVVDLYLVVPLLKTLTGARCDLVPKPNFLGRTERLRQSVLPVLATLRRIAKCLFFARVRNEQEARKETRD